MILIYTTYPNQKSAETIILHLLKKKLIACANVFPVQSMYRFEKKIKKEKEIVAILKTTKDKKERIEHEFKKIHPYKVPCIISLPVKANKECEHWVQKEVHSFFSI